jgi:hypothetical protein
MCKFGHGVVKLASHYKIDVFARVQRLFRLDVPMRANKRDLQPRIGFLDFPDQLDITAETNSGGIKHQEFIALADFNGLFPVDFVR